MVSTLRRAPWAGYLLITCRPGTSTRHVPGPRGAGQAELPDRGDGFTQEPLYSNHQKPTPAAPAFYSVSRPARTGSSRQLIANASRYAPRRRRSRGEQEPRVLRWSDRRRRGPAPVRLAARLSRVLPVTEVRDRPGLGLGLTSCRAIIVVTVGTPRRGEVGRGTSYTHTLGGRSRRSGILVKLLSSMTTRDLVSALLRAAPRGVRTSYGVDGVVGREPSAATPRSLVLASISERRASSSSTIRRRRALSVLTPLGPSGRGRHLRVLQLGAEITSPNHSGQELVARVNAILRVQCARVAAPACRVRTAISGLHKATHDHAADVPVTCPTESSCCSPSGEPRRVLTQKDPAGVGARADFGGDLGATEPTPPQAHPGRANRDVIQTVPGVGTCSARRRRRAARGDRPKLRDDLDGGQPSPVASSPKVAETDRRVARRLQNHVAAAGSVMVTHREDRPS